MAKSVFEWACLVEILIKSQHTTIIPSLNKMY